jgi:hypothetical protein
MGWATVGVAAALAAVRANSLGASPARAAIPNNLAKNDFRDGSWVTVNANGQIRRNKWMEGGKVNQKFPPPVFLALKHKSGHYFH